MKLAADSLLADAPLPSSVELVLRANARLIEGVGASSRALEAAILDRLLHQSHVITIRGDSYRLREKRRSGLLEKPLRRLNQQATNHHERGPVSGVA